MSRDEFNWCLDFIVHGGSMLDSYDEFHRVVKMNHVYKVVSRTISTRHRLNIGTIVSDTMVQVKYLGGGRIGSIEEWFISRLKVGDSFWFTGKNLEIVRIKDMTVFVKRSAGQRGIFPSWQGGRMPLSSQLSHMIRLKLDDFLSGKVEDPEIESLGDLFQEQQIRSHMPSSGEFLIEKITTKDGYHVFFYPFEGRNVHTGLAALFAYRLSQIKPMTFSMAVNDYGFELLCDQVIPIEEALGNALFDTHGLSADIYASVNIAELARKKFRDIATISGLVFNGFPGKQAKTRHIQANSQLFFNVFNDQDQNNLLLQQAYDEVLTFEMEQGRMTEALNRMMSQQIVIRELEQFSPFCFPILTERFREKYTNEEYDDQIKKILSQNT